MPRFERSLLPLRAEIVTDFRVFHGKHESFPYAVGMHYHEHYEILLHDHGGTRLVIGQSVYEMGTADLYIIPPFYIHGILTDQPLQHYERTWVHVTPVFLQSLGLGEVSFPSALDSLVASGGFRFLLARHDYDSLKAILNETRNLAECASPFERMASRLSLSRFFNELCEVLTPSLPHRRPENTSNQVIQRVFNYIGENCTEDLTLDSLAAQFNLSKYYLSHLFSQVYKVSVYRYILMCRIAKAQQLIRTGESMTSVAQKCGFNDYSNFLRAFRQLSGVTPTVYQKRIQADGAALPDGSAGPRP